jgi:hypothetical protein
MREWKMDKIRTVYLVVISDYDVYDIQAIYSSKEEASKHYAAAKRDKKNIWRQYYIINEYEVEDKYDPKKLF